MTALRDIQATFIHDIYTGERTSLAYLDVRLASPSRLDIYQNNTVLILTEILANAFPVLKKIVGDDFFKTIARHYIKIYVQTSGNRHSFGDKLAKFLQEFKPAAALPYLSDIVTLEWAYFQAALADNAKPLDFKFLMVAIAVDPDFVLAVHSSVHIVPQTFNALEIWQEHQKKEVAPVRLKSDHQRLIVWRGLDDSILIRPVSDALIALVDHSREGIVFSKAMVIATESTNDIYTFQQEFAQAVSLGIFARAEGETSHD